MIAVADPGGAKGAIAPPSQPVKKGQKIMAAENGGIIYYVYWPPLS